MSQVWDQARLEQYITDGIEENLNLDYKAAASLDKSDGKKAEITKDVSAMANSAGGIIIYGIAEYQDKAREHLPEKIDPVDRTQFSKEWLEQVIGNIQPKIDGITIHPVSIATAPNHVVYVVDIPQSHTAHQAKDFRYYKRFNFASVMMADYELRDVMGRQQHARIELDFQILIHNVRLPSTQEVFPSSLLFGEGDSKKSPDTRTDYVLKVKMTNTGKVYAQYVEAFIQMPCGFVFDNMKAWRRQEDQIEHDKYCTYNRKNITRDKSRDGGTMFADEYDPARYVPILPSISLDVEDFPLARIFESFDWTNFTIKWKTHVDNASPHSGEIAIKDIKIIDKRKLAGQ